jgi:predicted short-subunit dehydrogenase-like oxidoreductase (DUF2520 family)
MPTLESAEAVASDGRDCYATRASRGAPRDTVRTDHLPNGGGTASWVARLRRSKERTEPRLVSAGRTRTGRDFIETAATSLRFAVIGAGRLGASLAIALRTQGASLVGFTAHNAADRAQAQEWLGDPAVTDITELVSLRPELYLVTVPDHAVPEVAANLAAALAQAEPAPTGDGAHPPVAQPAVAHTSGATSVAALDPCRQTGAATLVFHPLQTFSEPMSGSTRFFGAAIAITPSDCDPSSPAYIAGFGLARMLGARPFLLPDDKRSLYHAAATIACNYLVGLEHFAEQLFVKAGLPQNEALALFLPLVRATLDNLAAQGTVKALTGPLSRGDTQTIANHLDALAADAPHLLPVYRALGLATLDLVRLRAEIAPSVIAELAAILQDPDQPHTPPLRQPGA